MIKTFKNSAIWQYVARGILIPVAFSLVLMILIGVYINGFLRGYEFSQNNIESYLAQFLSKNTELVSQDIPTPTVFVTPTISKKKTTSSKGSFSGPELWTAVNNKRQEYGVNPLSQKDELCTIASIRLNALLDLNKLDGHEGFSKMQEDRPDLKWIFDKYSTIAEFLAVGGDTPEETVSLWEDTLGHRKLLTGGEYVWGCIYSQNTFAVAITAY